MGSMNKYMEIANRLSKQNLITNDGGPFGAVIIKDGFVVGVGNNQVLYSNDPTAHAEIVAIRDACEYLETYDLTGCELYTSCYPCPMCLSAIIWSNIKKVYYGNTKEDAEKIGFRDNKIYEFISGIDTDNKSTILELTQIDRDETIKVFNEYMEKSDKTIY